MQLTEKKTFVITQSLDSPISCLFMNRFGVFEQIQLTKYKIEKLDTEVHYFGSVDHNKTRTVTTDKTLTYYTQWYSMDYFDWLKDLVLSPMIFIDGNYVMITNTKYEKDNTLQLFSIELNVLPQYSENVLSL